MTFGTSGESCVHSSCWLRRNRLQLWKMMRPWAPSSTRQWTERHLYHWKTKEKKNVPQKNFIEFISCVLGGVLNILNPGVEVLQGAKAAKGSTFGGGASGGLRGLVWLNPRLLRHFGPGKPGCRICQGTLGFCFFLKGMGPWVGIRNIGKRLKEGSGQRGRKSSC